MYAARKFGTGGRPSRLRLVRGDADPMRDLYYGRKALMQTLGQLQEERSTWEPHWRELGKFQLPRAPRFQSSDRNKGTRRHRELYNDAATRAIRVGGAGLMAGTSSQARTWFKIQTSDPGLMRSHASKLWLDDTERRIRADFERANTYLSIHAMYENLLAFGTACNVVLGDTKTGIWHYPSALGEFYVATDYRGQVVTLYRIYRMTVRELIEQFGIENVSRHVREQKAQSHLETQIEVCHAIERRRDRDVRKIDNRNMPWKSCWFETSECEEDYDQLLRESGFKRFPALVPRWWVEGNDAYGGCPGMDALGRIKGLQLREVEQARAFEYGVRPPLTAPTVLKGRGVNLLPHGISYFDGLGSGQGIRALYEVDARLVPHFRADMDRVEQAINEAYFKDLFLMIATSSDTTQRTREEIIERREEKMVVIGPAYARIQRELLAPLVELAFWEAFEQGRLAPLPRELEGQDLQIKFVSILAQALERIGMADQDQFVVRLGAVANINKDALDAFDVDGWVDSQSGIVDPRLIVPIEERRKIRKARNDREAAMEQAAMAEQQAKTAQSLAGAQTSEPSVLTSLTGYGNGGI